MPSFLQIENISKSYGPKVLFDHIGFNINEGDKIALIAPNGSGKTSLLRILAGKDSSDSGGRVLFLRHIRIAFLEQEFEFSPGQTIRERVLSPGGKEYSEEAYGFELRFLRHLTAFGLNDPDRLMGELSGGEVKRVALAAMLASEAEFFIMDEPTNHLDIDAIEYLEGALARSRCTLLMVTHDRYFLDNVCNTVMELDRGQIWTYRGGYQSYLQKRQERIDNYNAETDKVRNILRRELEWMRSTPQARSGKAKYRKDAFYELKERAEDSYVSRSVDMGGLSQGEFYLGNKVINCKSVSFSRGGKKLVDSFTYNFARGERVGIVGPNGCGKTTLLDLLTGELSPDGGSVDPGESLRTGYYRQDGLSLPEGQTVLETVSDTALLSRFLFPHDMLSNKVSSLSGGEKRRLYLLTILLRKPNLLILDEPTNDLDIITLNILEEYLLEFKGTLIIVSHDRHFLDRLADHLFIMEPGGTVKDFIGDWTTYRQQRRDSGAQAKEKPAAPKVTAPRKERPPKLSFKEKRELEALEERISALEEEKAALEEGLSSGSLDPAALQEASLRYGQVKDELDEAELRWLELSEKNF